VAEGSSEEKRHAPTDRRLRQAAEKGNIKRSQDFPKAAVTTAMIVGAMTAAGGLCGNLADYCASWLSLAGVSSVADANSWVHSMIGVVGPVVFFFAAISLFASLFSGGWVFSLEQLMPDFSKIMPDHGLGQVFSMNGLVETGKNLLKVTVIGGAGGVMIILHQQDFAALAGLTTPAPGLVLSLAFQALVVVGIVVLTLGSADLGLQYWMHRQQLRMSDSEIREEMKDVAGNPHVKSQQRRLARKMARARQMKRIPEASVIVTNPTHYAVAIRYRRGVDRAPLLLAKGVGLLAAKIVSLGKGHGVPVVEAPPLARAVYRYVEPDEHVPVALYRACAEVLAYVWRMQKWRSQGGEKPKPPKVPEGEIVVPGRFGDPIE
jgi:flagellar biosynthetic protein FlhB